METATSRRLKMRFRVKLSQAKRSGRSEVAQPSTKGADGLRQAEPSSTQRAPARSDLGRMEPDLRRVGG